MSIGERIRYPRIRMGLTQKALGILVGFPDKTARIRISQYETGGVLPNQEPWSKLANIFQISSLALNVPDIDTDRMDDAQIKADFNELYRQMNGMELPEMDKIIYPVCTLCRDHERDGFIEEVKIGILLYQELNLS